jgi:hypothetical protein
MCIVETCGSRLGCWREVTDGLKFAFDDTGSKLKFLYCRDSELDWISRRLIYISKRMHYGHSFTYPLTHVALGKK